MQRVRIPRGIDDVWYGFPFMYLCADGKAMTRVTTHMCITLRMHINTVSVRDVREATCSSLYEIVEKGK